MMEDHFQPLLRILLCEVYSLSQWDYPNLSAPYWRLYWNQEPGAMVLFRGQKIFLKPSHCMLIAPNTPFEAQLRRPVEHFYLHFLSMPPYDRLEAEIFVFPATSARVSIIREIWEISRQQMKAPHRLSLLAHVLAHDALCQVPASRFEDVQRDVRVREAIQEMARNPAEALSVSALAREARMNPNSFIRLFRQVTGQTPHAFLLNLRVDHACLLLHNSSMGIEEVAEAVGFCDRYHFSRIFRKIRGMGPAAFRGTRIHRLSAPG